MHDKGFFSNLKRMRWALFAFIALVVAFTSTWILHTSIPRHIVIASGATDGVYHQYAQRYKEILARDGVTVEERITNGATDNKRLLLDPNSGVDVAFMQGGVISPSEAGELVMIASLYYEPLWIFYRDPATLTKLNQLAGKRIAVGRMGSGTRTLVLQLLAANGLINPDDAGGSDTEMTTVGGAEALSALKAGEVDAAFYVGGANTPTIEQAARDPTLKLMSLDRVDADVRHLPFLTKLTLPAGVIDLATNIPPDDVRMIGAKAMLVSRDSLSPAIIQLLLDAAKELHSGPGYFEGPDEFPNTAHLDLPVSTHAARHLRFGPSLLHRYLPFTLATYAEHVIVILLPMLVVLLPLFNFLPRIVSWRARSRVYRLYGELALLERDVNTRPGALPIERWLADLDRIEKAAAYIRTPTNFASEAYTLREHIALVRRAVMVKAQDSGHMQ